MGMLQQQAAGAQAEQTGMTRVSGIDANALQIRLNPEVLLSQIELFLRGERLSYKQHDDTGKMEIIKVSCGEALANDVGVQMIMSNINLIINTQTVQGNIKREDYFVMMKDVKLNLAYNLMTCYKDWGIKKTNRRFINRAIENCCRLYISRSVDNKERESYGESIIHKENTKISDNRPQLDKS